ncbi:MAG: NERD domain-containing protein [Alcanivoracaceae bacterium]|nr:NERD domain-containing protein [Alcanivoracaceae bacterium]
MAVLIPALSTCKRTMTPGEKRLGERLEQKLEDDYLIWYEPAIGPRALHPDFLVLHPRRGILVLEVKDWRLSTLHRVDKLQVELLTDTGIKKDKNPFEQGRVYAHALADLLKLDPALVASEGDYAGKLLLPWSHGVVLPNITRKQFHEAQLGEVMPPARVICGDEMTESVDAEAFQERLWNMFPVSFNRVLSLPQIDRIRWHLFPEIRLGEQRDLFVDNHNIMDIPDVLKLMDLQQEQLARSLGDGHRVIHGVAGSGKTMILGYRAEYLAKVLVKPILVLCYNRVLADKLRDLIVRKGLEGKVQVYNFHAWCRQQLVSYQATLPAASNDFNAYADELVNNLIRGVDSGQIPAGQYGAIMIDEGHDFEPHWLKLVVQMVSQDTSSLLVLYDDAQNIYGKKANRQKFSFKSVGIQAAGRTTILKLNYRNTAEILDFAYQFAKDVLQPADMDDDGVPLIQPQSSARAGRKPEVIKLPRFEDKLKAVIERFQSLEREGWHYSDMALVYRYQWQADQAEKLFQRCGIPVKWLKQANKGKGRAPAPQQADAVNFVTMHSSKGLEFPVVAVAELPDVEKLPEEKREEEVRLAYVAMTRATEVLVGLWV